MKKTQQTLECALKDFLDKVETAKDNDAVFKYETYYSSIRIILLHWQTSKGRYNVYVAYTDPLPRQHFFFAGDSEADLCELTYFLDYLEKHFMFTLGDMEG